MASSQLPSIEVLRQLIRHEAHTGLMWWKERDVSHFACGSVERCRYWNERYAGTPALNMNIAYGYLGGTLFRQKVKAHRVMWALVYGEWPSHGIDHINHDKRDNRIANLRDVSQAENMKNITRPRRQGNRSPVMGVYFIPLERAWKASIGREHHLGTFKCLGEAIRARKQAEKHHGYHQNHGK